MNQQEIINQLEQNHKIFINYIKSLSDDSFIFRKEEKWSAGQQLEHICRAVSPLNLAFSLPNFVLKMLFGKANRPSKSYDELVKKYQDKLQNGATATGRFVPPIIKVEQKERLCKKLSKSIDTLNQKIKNYTEQELDTFILPHPLLGKVTTREMLYFTIYHVEHHLAICKRDVS
jgi:DinB superfamily